MCHKVPKIQLWLEALYYVALKGLKVMAKFQRDALAQPTMAQFSFRRIIISDIKDIKDNMMN